MKSGEEIKRMTLRYHNLCTSLKKYMEKGNRSFYSCGKCINIIKHVSPHLTHRKGTYIVFSKLGCPMNTHLKL